MNDQDVAELRAHRAKIDKIIAAYDAEHGVKQNSKPNGIEVREPQVSAVIDECRGDEPTQKELQALLVIASREYPDLRALLDREEQGFARFCNAARFLRNKPRAKEPNRGHYLSHFIDEAEFWLRARNIHPTKLRGPDLLLAVIASGDISFITGDNTKGQLWEVGLATYGGDNPDPSAWRKVLKAGPLKPWPSRYK
jgi:hypothetical protein